jgi:hypothetical protein
MGLSENAKRAARQVPGMRVLLVAAVLLLAGCLADEGQPPRPVARGQDAAMDLDFPGLLVEGNVTPQGKEVVLHALATNYGPHTYRVSSICVPPWSESMRDADGNEVQHREPMAVCLAFGLKELAPGEAVPFNATWDGRLWDGGYGPAPSGVYTWLAHFQVYSGGDGADFEDSATLTLEFPVEIP